MASVGALWIWFTFGDDLVLICGLESICVDCVFGYVGCFNVRHSCHACCSRIVCWLVVCCLFVLVVALLLGFVVAVWICLASCWFCCVWVGVLAFGCGFVLLGGLNLVCWFCCVSCC